MVRVQTVRKYAEAFCVTEKYVEDVLNGMVVPPVCLRISTSNVLRFLVIDFDYGTNHARLNCGDYVLQDERGDWFWLREKSFREQWEVRGSSKN